MKAKTLSYNQTHGVQEVVPPQAGSPRLRPPKSGPDNYRDFRTKGGFLLRRATSGNARKRRDDGLDNADPLHFLIARCIFQGLSSKEVLISGILIPKIYEPFTVFICLIKRIIQTDHNTHRGH